jgi:hypothetical protein
MDSSPEGAAVNSQGRKALERDASPSPSPEGAAVNSQGREALGGPPAHAKAPKGRQCRGMGPTTAAPSGLKGLLGSPSRG